ncbi:hypothetical protein M8044_000529, partial [Columbia Basin potato purple top phytoplasma]|nr:hypothetical protein [Columbia Basin potato purple top phytoplasma]
EKFYLFTKINKTMIKPKNPKITKESARAGDK